MPQNPLHIASLRTAFLSGELSVTALIERVLRRIREWDDPAIWITRTSDAGLRQRASGCFTSMT